MSNLMKESLKIKRLILFIANLKRIHKLVYCTILNVIDIFQLPISFSKIWDQNEKEHNFHP
jgi:hypothetical protein